MKRKESSATSGRFVPAFRMPGFLAKFLLRMGISIPTYVNLHMEKHL